MNARYLGIVGEMPKEWKVLDGATTAPKGSIWVYNGINILKPDFRYALLQEEEEEKRGKNKRKTRKKGG